MKYLFRLEVKKNLCSKKIIIVFAVLICLKIAYTLFFTGDIKEDIDINVYKEYVYELYGKHSTDKLQYIQDEIERYETLARDEEVYEKQFMSGQLSSVEYRNILNEIKKSSSVIRTLSYIQMKSEYFEFTYKNGEYFYDLDIRNYFLDTGIDIFALVYLIFIISVIFTIDYQTNTNVFVETSVYGKKHILNIRIFLTLICTIIISFIFQAVELITWLVTRDLGNIDAPLKSIMEFSNCSFDVSIRSFIIIVFFTRLLFLIEISVIIIFIAKFSRNTIAIFTGSLGIIVLPDLMYDTLPEFIRCILPGTGFSGIKIYNPVSKILDIRTDILSWIVMILISVFLIGYLEYRYRE